jgi:osmoprotectant transport system permease protein
MMARSPLLWLGLAFVLLLFGMPALAPLFARGWPDVVPPVFAFQSFPMLFLSHLALVVESSLVSIVVAVSLGIFVTRPLGRDFRAMAGTLAAIGQTCPPVAVLAIAVPSLGYGELPTFVALTLYGLLPILANTIAGIETVPEAVRDAAQGMGLSPAQILRRVELPLAAPAILAGIRLSVVINIGTATIGSTVGAVTLGTPIIDGLVGDKLPYVLQGAALVGLFAILTDMAFERIDRRLRLPRGG